MRTKRIIWTKRIVKLLLLVVVYWLLLKCGINPFWSILVMLYWKTLLKVALFLGGVAWVITLMMY